MALQILPAIQVILNAIDAKSLQQITGAHHFEMINGKTLRFRLPAYVANKQINRVTITAIGDTATYEIRFTRKTKVAGVSEEVVVDVRTPLLNMHLLSCIGNVTGLIVDKFDTTL